MRRISLRTNIVTLVVLVFFVVTNLVFYMLVTSKYDAIKHNAKESILLKDLGVQVDEYFEQLETGVKLKKVEVFFKEDLSKTVSQINKISKNLASYFKIENNYLKVLDTLPLAQREKLIDTLAYDDPIKFWVKTQYHWRRIHYDFELLLETPMYEDSVYYLTESLSEPIYDEELGTFITESRRKYTKKVLSSQFMPLVNFEVVKLRQFKDGLAYQVLTTKQKGEGLDNSLSTIYKLWFWLNVFLVIVGALIFYLLLFKKLDVLTANFNNVLQGKNQTKYTSLFQNIKQLQSSLNTIDEVQKKSVLQIEKMKKGEFDEQIDFPEITGEGDVSLTKSLLSLKEQMQEQQLQAEIRRWEVEGRSQIGKVLQQSGKSLKELSDEVIAALVSYLGANQGGLFVIEERNEIEVLNLISSFAFDKQKFVSKTIEIGEGLVGQAWQEKDVIYIKDLPESHMKIKSGLGDAGPKNLIIIPLLDHEEVFGIIELASFNILKDYQIEFLKNIGYNIAAALSVISMNAKTKTLLDNAQELTSRLQIQEEDMRENIEDLLLQLEQANSKINELHESFAQQAEEYEEVIKELKKQEKFYYERMDELREEIDKAKNDNAKIRALQLEIENLKNEHANTLGDLEETIKIKDMRINKLRKKLGRTT